ncbi:MAG: hypothetical protein K2Y21_10385 [Phycisphaerales bacterium]|nr:hypothetical protein [Phycisphaerales bacterium]
MAEPGTHEATKLDGSAPPSKSAIALLRDVQSGKVIGTHLAAPDRQRVVEHLIMEGYGTQEIAEILKVADRTIQRDRVKIREQNAVRADPALAPVIVGQMMAQAEASASRLRRIARDKETPASARVEAEMASWNVTKGCVETLMDLGYLPKAPQQIQGQFMAVGVAGGVDAIVELKQRRDELQRLRGIARDPSILEEVDRSVQEINQQLALATTSQVIHDAQASLERQDAEGTADDLQKPEPPTASPGTGGATHG